LDQQRGVDLLMFVADLKVVDNHRLKIIKLSICVVPASSLAFTRSKAADEPGRSCKDGELIRKAQLKVL